MEVNKRKGLKVWDWINPMLFVAQRRKKRRNWMQSPTAPCTTPTDRVLGLAIPCSLLRPQDRGLAVQLGLPLAEVVF